jgi:hypothetical protein
MVNLNLVTQANHQLKIQCMVKLNPQCMVSLNLVSQAIHQLNPQCMVSLEVRKSEQLYQNLISYVFFKFLQFIMGS